MAINFDIGSINPASGGPVWAGTAITLVFSLTNSPQTMPDTSTWTVMLTFKKSRYDNSVIKQYMVPSSSTGTWTQPMTRADTLLFSVPGTYEYDFERVDVGSEAVLTWGKFQIDRKVNS